MEWISVKDRLPEENGEYLIWYGEDGFDTGYWNTEYPDMFTQEGGHVLIQYVTHWMKIEPPQ